MAKENNIDENKPIKVAKGTNKQIDLYVDKVGPPWAKARGSHKNSINFVD